MLMCQPGPRRFVRADATAKRADRSCRRRLAAYLGQSDQRS